MTEDAIASSPTAGLRKTLGLGDLVAYGLAYITPIAPLTTLGLVWEASGGLLAAAYLLGALCMYFTAQSYVCMSAAVPHAGSVYGFARHCLGPLPGFIAGWMILLDYLLIPALVYVLMSVGMETLIPQIGRAGWICILVGISVLINWFGIKVTSRVSALSVGAQFVILFGILGFCLAALQRGAGTGGMTLQPFLGQGMPDWSRVFAGTSIAVLSFLGFDAISTLSEEVRGDDRRLIGRAILCVLGIAGVSFVLAAWVLGNLMPGATIQDPAAAIFELLTQTVGAWLAILLAWLLGILLGITNALPMQAGVARLLFAMGRDRALPGVLAKVHPRHGEPHVAMLVATAVSLVVALLLRDRVELLASLVNFGALSGFLLLHLSVMVLRAAESGWRRWGEGVVLPLSGMAVVVAVLSGMQGITLLLGLVWLILGVGYGLQVLRRKRIALDL